MTIELADGGAQGSAAYAGRAACQTLVPNTNVNKGNSKSREHLSTSTLNDHTTHPQFFSHLLWKALMAKTLIFIH